MPRSPMKNFQLVAKKWRELYDAPHNVGALRYQARCAWLDNQKKRAAQFNKLAEAMEKRLAKAEVSA